MYIRTQDKRQLVPINNMDVSINYTDTTQILAVNPFNDDYSIVLGKYKDGKRCTEILDQIQNEVMYNNHYSGSGVNSSDCQNWSYGVYQMPIN